MSDDDPLLTTVEGIPVYPSDVDATANDDLRALVEEWQEYQPEEHDSSALADGYERGLKSCAEELEELIGDVGR